jgi:hypothetical protein
VISGLLLVGLSLSLTGCGGTGSETPELAPVAPNTTGTFYSSLVQVLVGDSDLIDIGRGFVTLQGGVPTEVGLELSARAVGALEEPEFDVPGIYGVALPPEHVFTPFSFLAFSYWSAHSPRGIGDVPHFHPIVAVFPPGIPVPPDYRKERTAVAPNEVAQDYILGDLVEGGAAGETIAPGIGVAYEDPSAPQLQPGWDTWAQNYFYYNGHMNGIGLGATNAFLRRQQEGQEGDISAPIKQPQVYPKPGYYPHRHSLKYDSQRKVHIFVLEDFRQATQVVVQSRLQEKKRR